MIFMNTSVEPIYLFNNKTNYAVSKEGRVFKTKYNRGLKRKIDSKGYYVVSLSINGKIIDQRVHRLVAMAFIPNPNDYPIVNHLDGNKLNPHYTNLEWTTYKGNSEHAIRTGLIHPAKLENHGKTTLTNQQVSEICELMEGGVVSQREIAELYSVNETVIRGIRLGHNWVEISKNYNVANCKMIAKPNISDTKVIEICELLLENELSIKEIANKCEVTPFIVLSILHHKKHRHITDCYDFSGYSKLTRYPKDLIDDVMKLMMEGKSNTETITKLGLEKSQKTNTFLYRQRQKYKKMEKVGIG